MDFVVKRTSNRIQSQAKLTQKEKKKEDIDSTDGKQVEKN